MSGSTTPYPIGDIKNLQEALVKIQQYFDEMYQERVGGALIGDVFSVGDDEILSIALAANGGLQKVNGQIGVKVDGADALKIGTNGLGINDATKTKHGALPVLSDNADQYLTGKGTWVNPLLKAWPVGSVFFGTAATNPATLLGIGTWSLIGNGSIIIGAGTITAYAFQRTA